MLKDLMADNFQSTVSKQLICSRSPLNVLSHHQANVTKIQHTITNIIIGCGCIQMGLDRNLTGNLCDHCRERLENEIGRSMVYLAALCNSLDVNMFDVIIKEHHKMELLGCYI